jgi:DNA-binding YbaB/EbfC family protein
MFGNLKDLAQLPQMLQKLPEMQRKMAEVQEQLKNQLGDVRADADAGGGMVTATCNGRLELVNVKIDSARLDPSTAKPEDLELLEDLVVAAVAAAQKKAAEAASEVSKKAMTDAAAEAGLPMDMLDKLGGV